MKIKLPSKTLRSLAKAGNAVAKPTDDRQILRNLLLVATEQGLEVSATDTIVGLWLNVPAGPSVTIEKTGRAVVNSQNFLRTVETMPDRDVTLVATERGFQMTAGGSKFRLLVEDANDFPRLTRFSARKPFVTLDASTVLKMVRRTAFCAHDEPSFQLMHGMLVRATPSEIRMVATNGQRLSVTTLPVPVTESAASSIDGALTEARPQTSELVIPADVAVALTRIIGEETKTIDIQWLASFLNARSNLGEISIRALSGCYPPYGRGVPSTLRKLRMNRGELIEILKQTTAIKSPTSNFVSMRFFKDRIVFASIAEGAGDTEVNYEFQLEENEEERSITINPDFMLQTLNSFNSQYVSFEIGDAMTPTIIREEHETDAPASFCVYAVVRQ